MNLAQRLRQDSVPYKEAALLVAQIADALHYAHGQNVFHRDIKPGNILLDRHGEPYITDFGLAVHEDDLAREAGRRSGTLPYYSPEQARGEGHRIDGRTDIYSLGVVLYELLSGRHPFEANSKEQLVDQILHREAKPPRQLRDSIPRELERICLKALSKRITDRYTTAKDMADELRAATLSLDTAPTAAAPVNVPAAATAPTSTRHDSGSISAESPVHVVPKGLRSFGFEDQDFFLELLPGPRGREGLPDSIRFWKERIERDEATAGKSFAIGLIYGPSGCGKSSLVKAGLLPRLDNSIHTIYIEATRDGTEQQLERALRRSYPWMNPELGLAEMIAALRRRELADRREGAEKLLIVLDQFEQWLHARGNEIETELLAALRQCDGAHVQCILMVRDDFWIAISRFMRNLEVRLLDGDNIALVDLFDPAHARRVLTAFGRAFGRLPENPGRLSSEQRRFLDRAVASLAQNGEIIPVQLSLFSEMLKRKEWVPATLRNVGGIEGLGVTFLEETFSSRTANPEHRAHARAARSVLKVLLPEHGVEIKGHTRQYSELLESSGYAQDRRQFDELLRVLDTELRLVTPTDSEEVTPADAGSTAAASPQSYQLAHDYLVPSVRDWLTRKQKETRRGRSELLLADRAELWKARREKKQLPSLWEYVTIRGLTQHSRWTLTQREMMGAAAHYYFVRCAAAIAFVIVVIAAILEMRGRAIAHAHVVLLLRAETSDVPAVLQEMNPYRRWAVPRLRDVHPESDRELLHKELALHRLAEGPDKNSGRLIELLARATPEQARVVASELKNSFAQIEAAIWLRLQRASTPDEVLSMTTVAAAADPNDPHWNSVLDTIAQQFVVMQPDEAVRWIDNLVPIERSLAPRLEAILTATGRDDPVERQQRYVAALGLASFLQDDQSKLAQLLVFHCRQAPEYQSLLAPLLAARTTSLAHVRAIRATDSPTEPASPHREIGLSELDRAGNRVIAELMLGEPSTLLDHLQVSSDCTLRSTFIHRLSELGVPSVAVVSLLEAEDRPDVRAALVLALGNYYTQTLPGGVKARIENELQRSWQSGNAEEHAAAEWLAARWNIANQVRTNTELLGGARDWYANTEGQWLSIIRHRFDYNFALSSTEVTVAQYRRFQADYEAKAEDQLVRFLDQDQKDNCPAIYVTCHEAMLYCNWLSLQEGMSEEQCCYQDVGDGTVEPKADYLRLPGYRLPTFDEWKYACTAGTTTRFSFGENLRLLPQYAWYFGNSRFDEQHRAQPVGRTKPNPFGLSDMYGNVWEWLTRFDNPSWSLIAGGSCDNDPLDLQKIGFKRPDAREIRVGFRIAQTVFETEK